MRREETMQLFIEKEVTPRKLESLWALEAYFQTHKDELAGQFHDSFRRICKSFLNEQETGEKKRIGHFTYSILRTELVEGKHLYIVEASDEDWLYDEQPYVELYDASWVFRFFDQLWSELTEQAKTYMGVITLPDIEQMMLKEAANYHQYVVSLARYALPTSVMCAEYAQLKKDDTMEIRVGEYVGLSEVVYQENHSERDPAAIKKWLEEKAEDDYAYEVFFNLNLSQGHYEELDLRYSDFRKSDLSYSRLSGCLLIGANLKGCNMTESDLSDSFIHETNFSDSVLKQANFQGVEGASGLPDPTTWDMPGFLPVSFEGADLEGANFEGAVLQGASFVGANLKDVNFTRANLEKAVFSKEAKEMLVLDDKQKAGIIWR